MKILAIQNCQIEGFGLYEQYLIAQNIDYKVIHAYRDGDFPPVDEVNAILIGGTPVAAYEADEYPFLQTESDFLRRALAVEKPCFGICFGAQLLAQILGAHVHKCRQKEIGGYEVRLTLSGQSDSLLAGFPRRFPVFHWHGDTFDIPAGAELLVEGDDCRNQLFRRGNVAGVQFHFEVTAKEASIWADEYVDELAEFGKNKAQVVAECRDREQKMKLLAERLLHNFLNAVL